METSRPSEYKFADALAKFQDAERVAQILVAQAQSHDDHIAAAGLLCRSLIDQTHALVRLDRRAEASTRYDQAHALIAEVLPTDQDLRVKATMAAVDLNPSGSPKSLAALEETLAAMPGRGRDLSAIPAGSRKRIAQLRTSMIDYYANIGDTAHALAESASLLELDRAWVVLSPGDAEAKLALVIALHHAAQHLFASGPANRESALVFLREAEGLLQSLRKNDPANLDLLEQAGLLANIFTIVTGDPAEQAEHAERAVAAARELATMLPRDAHRREVLITYLQNLAALESAKDRESSWKRCEEILGVLADGAEHFRSPVMLPVTALGMCGTVQEFRKQPALATALHFRAVEIARPTARDPHASLELRAAYVAAVLGWLSSMPTDDARGHLDEMRTAVALLDAEHPKAGRPLGLLQYAQQLIATLSAPAAPK